MELSSCRIGVVVQESQCWHTDDESGDIGHVKGFDRNCVGEILVVVEFSKEGALGYKVRTMHPANISLYEG